MNSNKVSEMLGRESPNILTAVSLVSSFTAVFLSIKATIFAMEKLRKEGLEEEELRTKIKSIWQLYLPTALVLTLNVSCIIGVFTILSKRNKDLSGLYLVAIEGLREYQAQVLSIVGEKKNEKIRDSVAQHKLDSRPIDDKTVIFAAGKVLFFDAYSGRYFFSTMEEIKKAINAFNYELLVEMFKPLNEFYYEIGLDPIDAGDGIGWGIENRLDVEFSAQIIRAPGSKYDEQPCIILSYTLMPHYLS